ncbi:hypothetical protein LXA43DRAFT_1066601 [Ganoderma leucocontextum]|nr:hypothetical protein LXA43DRAFT_1066601 [Ganoderma leucocontextum]
MSTPSEASLHPYVTGLTAIAAWEKTENLAIYLLSQKLPDVTFTKRHRKGMTAAIWSAIVKEFTEKSILLCANLCTSFLNLQYKSGADLHAEFDRICVAYEELLNADVDISDAKYASLIINFVPSELSTFISQLSATAKITARMQALSTAQSSTAASSTSSTTVLSGEKPILDAEMLMDITLEEWERRQADKGKGKAKDAGVAASVLSSEKLKKGKGKHGLQKPIGVCWTCGGKGHKQAACPSPNPDEKGKGSNAKLESSTPRMTAAAATAPLSLDDIAGAWSAFVPAYVSPYVETDTESDSLGVDDTWSDDAASDYTALTEVSDGSMPSLQTVPDSSAESDEDGASSAPGLPMEDVPMLEPVSIEQRMSSVAAWLSYGFGEGREGDDPTPLTASAAAMLKPFTATAAGYTSTFASGECMITDHDGATVGRVPKSHGLYIVTREHGEGTVLHHITVGFMMYYELSGPLPVLRLSSVFGGIGTFLARTPPPKFSIAGHLMHGAPLLSIN